MNFQVLQLQLYLHKELQLAHSFLVRKEEELRKTKAELNALRTSKAEADKLVSTLTDECTTLHARIVADHE